MKRLIDPNNYLAILNGLIGDRLSLEKHPWAIPMSFRVGAKNVSVSQLESSFKSKRIIIYVHGLMADEGMWKNFVEHEKNLSVLHVRYNTGLHISQNGEALAQLLNDLQKRFNPKRLYLAGHSMGGLVIRSACYYGTEKRHAWVSKVSVIFLLAVPNAGAPLEKLSHVTSLVLRKIARWYLGEIGDILEQRSNGIKDLRHGSMLEEDWNPKHAKSSVSAGERSAVPPIPGVAYHILVGTLLSDESSLMAKYFGDGLVTQHSAVGATLMKVATVQTFANTGHNAILNNSEVHRYVYKVLKGVG